MKIAGQNQSRPFRYRVRSPPQIYGKCRLYSVGAAMNFIVRAMFLPLSVIPVGFHVLIFTEPKAKVIGINTQFLSGQKKSPAAVSEG